MKPLSVRQVEKIIKACRQGGSTREVAESAEVGLMTARSYMLVYSQFLKIEGLPPIKMTGGRSRAPPKRDGPAKRQKVEARPPWEKRVKRAEMEARIEGSCRCGQTKQPGRDQCAKCIRREIVARKAEEAEEEGLAGRPTAGR